MMNYRPYIVLFLFLMVLGFMSCKKDEDPNIQSITFEREYFQYTPTAVTVSGVYAYDGRIDGIKMQVGQRHDLADAHAFVADIDGTNYTVEATGLQPGTEYHYCYEVDYGFSKPYKTETKTFATPADSPLVKTLDVMSIDSTSVRVNCETVSDCGMEITERGVCWNTYGNPNLDDESLAYTSVGLGQYSCRINNLALGRKYYVKAYAKNASGIGFGEELEFETTAPLGMPVSIELSCDPEEGGSVSGGGIHMVGSQCTVTAVANSGYTFVNWTENGNQVSTEATYTFNVTRECHLVAHFTTQAYIITAEVTPDNSGTVTGTGGYNYGEECTLTANAKPGYEFVKWTKNGTNVSTEASFTFTVNASATYVAHFQTKSYTVNVSAQPSNGGTVTGGGTFNYGQSCTVHAAPADGFVFMNWTDGGDVVSSDANYTFTVTGNRDLVARFIASGGGDHEYVDLGLPSGTLWATCNVGANSPEEYGDYFAWGETQPKSDYSWGTYQYCNGSASTLTKYCNNASCGYNGFTDNLTTLQPSDDAATANWGTDWRMPTEEEWQELYNSTTHIWTTQNGVNGRLFTATNGNSLFLPAAGSHVGTSLYDAGTSGHYWSSSLNTERPDGARGLYFYSGNCVMGSYGYRYDGRSVRPVRGGNTPTPPGNVPEGAINGLFTINSNGDQVYFSQGNLQYQASTNTWRFAENQWDYIGTQTPDNYGNVGGTVTGSDNSDILQTYSGWIDLFGWGTSGYNHGAVCYRPWSTSQAYRDYYAYGSGNYNLFDQTGQADWGYNAISNGGNTTNTWRTLTGGSNGEWKYIFETRSTPSGIRYAKAKVNGVNGVILLPDDWSASYYSLSNTNQDGASYSSNVISSTQWSTLEQYGAVFLPAAGYRDGTSVYCVGSYSDYWSASYHDGNNASNVHFSDGDLDPWSCGYRFHGFSVRLVAPAEN